MKTLYFSVGLSGSGKDWYFKNQFLSDFPYISEILIKNSIILNDIIVCPDDLRREIYGDVNNHTKSKELFEIAKSRLLEILNKYNIAIFNATNISKDGLRYINKIKYIDESQKFEKIALIFKPNIQLSFERINKQLENGEDRSRVSSEILEEQYLNFKKRVIGDENWDGIWNLDVKTKIIKRFKDRFPNVFFIEN